MTRDPVSLLPPRILVVDDERQIHASLRLRLGSTCTLEYAFDAQEALQKIRQQQFDLCFADIHMPKMDGLAFIDAAQEFDPDLGFVVLSAFDSSDNLRRAIPLQVYNFLSKPLPERPEFEGRIPEWVEKTRRRRRDQELARDASVIAGDRDAARWEREVELVASETARDALRQTAGLLTTIHAHLQSATTLLATRARSDSSVTHLLRGLEEARKTSDAAMTVAEGFFDSAYGSRDTSPAILHEGIPHAIDITLRMCQAEAAGKAVDFRPVEAGLPIRNLSGIEFLLLMVSALGATLVTAAPNTTVGVQGEYLARLDTATRDPGRRNLYWLNRRNALGSHPAVVLTLTASAPPLAPADFEAWLAGHHPPLAAVPSQGLVRGIQKCHGLIGAAVSPLAERFTLVLVLPT